MSAETIQRVVLSTALLLLGASSAWAQAEEQGEQDQQGQEQQPEQAPQEGGTIRTQDYSPEGQRPEPPGPTLGEATSEASFDEVAIDAGVGSPLSYASQSVVELGGIFALTFVSDITTFRLTPVLGYFFMDNVELSLLPDLTVVDVDGETETSLGLLVEPSYHLPISDRVFAFIGLGAGFTYATDPGADFAMRPRLGLDITVGRSGIFKPAFFLDFFAEDGVERGGLEASFTVML